MKRSGPYQRKIRAGFRFRVSKKFTGEKDGLYFDNIMHGKGDWAFRLHDKEIVEIRDWLSRYINKFIFNKETNLTVESRAHARAIIRAQDKLETK